MGKEAYIPMNTCKDGHLYIIDARNADIGVYVESLKGFRIRRNKFQLTFIDVEYHWDSDEYTMISGRKMYHGTVKPLRKLNYLGHMSDDRLLVQLNNYMRTLYYDIMKLKGNVNSSFILIDTDRMRQLKIFKGGD